MVRKYRNRRRKRGGVILLFLCVLLALSQRPAFSKALQKTTYSSGSLPYEIISFVCHTVATVNGRVQYINEKYQNLIGPNLYIIKQLIYGQGRIDAEGEFYEKSRDSIFGIGIGFKRYLDSSHLTNLWYEGSVNLAHISTTFKGSGKQKSTTELSGVLIGNIGYTWFFEERLAIEILVGLAWPSLYSKPGMFDDLYTSSFFGLGLSFAL